MLVILQLLFSSLWTAALVGECDAGIGDITFYVNLCLKDLQKQALVAYKVLIISEEAKQKLELEHKLDKASIFAIGSFDANTNANKDAKGTSYKHYTLEPINRVRTPDDMPFDSAWLMVVKPMKRLMTEKKAEEEEMKKPTMRIFQRNNANLEKRELLEANVSEEASVHYERGFVVILVRKMKNLRKAAKEAPNGAITIVTQEVPLNAEAVKEPPPTLHWGKNEFDYAEMLFENSTRKEMKVFTKNVLNAKKQFPFVESEHVYNHPKETNTHE